LIKYSAVQTILANNGGATNLKVGGGVEIISEQSQQNLF